MFVGTYTRKLQRGGWVRFPKDWLTLLGDNREVFILPDPNGRKSLSIAVADDFRKELKRTEESSKGTRTRRAFVDSAEKVGDCGGWPHANLGKASCTCGNPRRHVFCGSYTDNCRNAYPLCMMPFAACAEKAKDCFIHGANVSDRRDWRQAPITISVTYGI